VADLASPITKTPSVAIGGKRIGPGNPVYVVAEMSGNHNQSFDRSLELLRAAKDAGADAVKLQTYTPDTMTIDSDAPAFRVGGGGLWSGRTLYDLYKEAYMPWEWQPRLLAAAREMSIELFSSPFDATAVEHLERMGVSAYKIASFELVDLPLIERTARTGKPMFMSTGMATLSEIEAAVKAARRAGTGEIVLLKATSEYPADPADMNLAAIPHLAAAFGVPVGLSDHSRGIAVPIAAVALGASAVEKHYTLRRADGGVDAEFSLEPEELRSMIESIRIAERAIGRVTYGVAKDEARLAPFRRSLFVVKDTKRGEVFTNANVRSIRPANGLPPGHLGDVLGRRASRDIARGTPLSWDLVAGDGKAVS
jgi:pseudaminic acid synthase